MRINLFQVQSNPRPSLRAMALATSTTAMSPRAVPTAAIGTLDRVSISFGLFLNGVPRCPQWAGLCRAGRCRTQSKAEQEPPLLVRAHLSEWDGVPDTLLSGEGMILSHWNNWLAHSSLLLSPMFFLKFWLSGAFQYAGQQQSLQQGCSWDTS